MYITVRNPYGTVDFNTATYDTFRGLVASGMKINAIKMVREMLPSWGLKECKDFVEACSFPAFTPVLSKEDTTFLSEVKDDLRAILVTDEQYRNSLTLDLFARVCAKVGLAR